MARKDWLYEPLGLKGKILIIFIILGILLLLVYRRELSNNKSRKKLWTNASISDKSLIISLICIIVYLLYKEFSKSDTTDEEDK